MSLITQYEKAMVSYLESRISGTRFQLWADAFNTKDSQNRNSNFFLGHQRTERLGFITDAQTFRKTYIKRHFIEFRVELFTLKNHQQALDLIEYVLDELLILFRPYRELDYFTPQTSGEPRRNKENGSWLYTGLGYIDIPLSVQKLTLLSDKPLNSGKIIQIDFVNTEADAENKLIGRLAK